jgi:hypothetical protein
MADVLTLSDLANLGAQPNPKGPIQPKVLTLKDLAALGDEPKDEPPGFWDSFKKTITTGSPLNPGNWGAMLKSAIESPFSDEHFEVAQKLADQLDSGDAGGALKTAFGLPQNNSAAAGTATGQATNAAIVAALTAGLVKGAGWAADKAAILSKISEDPTITEAAIKTIPKGPEAKVLFDKLTSAYQKAKEAQQPLKPVPVLRDAESPAWANFPDPDVQPPPDLGSTPSRLPSGRVPGKPVAAPPVPASQARLPIWQGVTDTAAPAAEPAEIAPQAPARLPSGRLPGHSKEFEAQFTPQATPELTSQAAHEPKSDLEMQLEQSIPEAMIKRPATGSEPVVSPANQPLDEALKAKDAQASKAFEDAARLKKAVKVGKWLQDGELTPDQVDSMEPEHWRLAAKGAGVNDLSQQTIDLVKELMRMGQTK